jgi:hypothetical protein
MCETMAVRYTHTMEHDAYKGTLIVGCVCAGNMEGNPARAQARESSLRSRSGKRSRWLSRRWKVSAKGNDWLIADGYRVAVYPAGRGWKVTVASVGDNTARHSRIFDSSDRAKLAAFDFISAHISDSGQ